MVEDHVDDSVSKGNPHSNMDKMDVECASSSGSSDMVVDGVEDSTSVRSKSSRAYVSSLSISFFCAELYLFSVVVSIWSCALGSS